MVSEHAPKQGVNRLIVYILLGVISVLLLANIFLIYQNSNVIERNRLLQEEAEKIKVNTLDIIRTLHQIDMGLRGYALIDSKGQLEIATGGFVRMHSIFDSLEVSLSAQHFPMESLETLRDSMEIYFDVVRKMIAMVEQGDLTQFNSVLEENLGVYAYYSYLRFSNHVNEFENKIATDASLRYYKALKNSYLLQVLLFLITIPALFYMVFLFNRILKISEALRKAEQETVRILASQKENLEREVRDRTNDVLAQNEEISAQNEEIVAHNEQLMIQQKEIENQRNRLTDKNEKLEEAYKTIENQSKTIRDKNIELEREVDIQTSDLRKTNLELIEQNVRLEQFAYIISHNLRAPMARLIGLSSFLQNAENEEEKAKIINMILESTSDFDNVIKDLTLILDIQKLNTDVYTLVDLDEIMEKVVSVLETEISSTNAEIKKDFTNAPSLYSLPQYIESILYNLVSNALKYRHPERSPVISITSKIYDKVFQIIVNDNGIGMDLSRHGGNVFNLYKRFHFHVEGKGLGLYLVRTQVEALGGSIGVNSEVDKGTTFLIEFQV